MNSKGIWGIIILEIPFYDGPIALGLWQGNISWSTWLRTTYITSKGKERRLPTTIHCVLADFLNQ